MGFWQRLTGRATPTPAADTPTPPEAASAIPSLRWLEPAESPFGLRCLDCRALAASHGAEAPSGDQASRWLEEFRDDGRRLVGRHPERAAALTVALEYPPLGDGTTPADGALYKVGETHERWTLYHFAGWLYVVRSGSGLLVYRAALQCTPAHMRIERLETPGDAAESDPEFCVRELDYLIRSRVYRMPCPHPLPRELHGDDAALAEFSWQRHGPLGAYATYEDTLAVHE